MFCVPGPVLGADKAVNGAARDPDLDLRTQQGEKSQLMIEIILWSPW